MAGSTKFNVGNTKASKLTGAEVMEIREKYASGIYTMNRLAREYHVTRNTISDIVHCITWQDLPGVAPQHQIDDAAARSMKKLQAMLDETGDLPPATAEVDDETLASMQHAVETMPKPEFLQPSAEQAARMAAYGVRTNPVNETASELYQGCIATVADQVTGGGYGASGTKSSKPAIQAPTMQDASTGHTDVSTPAPERGAISLPNEDGIAVEGAMLEDLLDQTTEESAK